MIAGLYVYEGSGPLATRTYLVLRQVKMKNPATRLWVEAVEYQRHGETEVYVREKREFLEKFRQWEPSDQDCTGECG